MTGYWWSPDDRRIAVERFDESMVGIVTRAAIGATGTKVFDQRYPVAGSENADVELYVMDPDGNNRIKVDLAAHQQPDIYTEGDPTDFYLARVDWAPDGSALYVQRQNREQTVLDMLNDPETGALSPVFTEKAAVADYWINLGDDYKLLQDGSLVWWSERDGFGHLYLYSADDGWKDARQLTRGSFVVTKLVGVDQAAERLFYLATSEEDPLEQHIYALDYGDPSAQPVLTDRLHPYGDDGREGADARHRSNGHAAAELYCRPEGQRLATRIEENALDADHPYAPYLASHRPTQYGDPSRGRHAAAWEMITPEIEPGKRYPVYYYHYSGPGPQIVNRGWNGALPQAIDDRGYIWFALDNRGSNYRGVAFEQPIYRVMGGVEVRDQKAGAEYLRTLDFVDPDKIAIDGWSYGGYMTLKQLQADPSLASGWRRRRRSRRS